MKTFLFLLLTICSCFAVEVRDMDNIFVPDSNGILQNSGKFEDSVANAPSLASDIKDAVKAYIEAKAEVLDTCKAAKVDMTRAEVKGVTFSSETKEALEAKIAQKNASDAK